MMKAWAIALAAAWIGFAFSNHSDNAISLAVGGTISLMLFLVMFVVVRWLKL